MNNARETKGASVVNAFADRPSLLVVEPASIHCKTPNTVAVATMPAKVEPGVSWDVASAPKSKRCAMESAPTYKPTPLTVDSVDKPAHPTNDVWTGLVAPFVLMQHQPFVMVDAFRHSPATSTVADATRHARTEDIAFQAPANVHPEPSCAREGACHFPTTTNTVEAVTTPAAKPKFVTEDVVSPNVLRRHQPFALVVAPTFKTTTTIADNVAMHAPSEPDASKANASAPKD